MTPTPSSGGRLAGKTAIITGASSGIGAASARLFAAEGAAVVLGARRADRLGLVAEEIRDAGGRASVISGDVRDEAFAHALVEMARSCYGGLDIAFNNAGCVGEMGPVAAMNADNFREVIEVNLTGVFLGAKHQIPAMLERGGGSWIATSSFVGVSSGFPGMSAYAAAKAGVVGLTRNIASEHGADGIRANALLPGGTDTDMNAARAPGADPGLQAFIEGLHGLKRIARPEEIAEAALFLASDASSFVTGSAFFADGGVSIQKV